MIDNGKDEMKQYEIFVSGRVQGIGYRYFAERAAQNLGIKGFVRNLPDGRVKVIASGEDKSMEHFIEKLRQGPALSLVRDVQLNEVVLAEDYKDFQIEF